MKRFNAFSFNFDFNNGNTSIKENFGGGLSVSPYGGIKMVDEDLSIKQSIMMILSMVPGERVMRPDYGCELYKIVFSPNDETTAGLAIHYIKKALSKWEKRIYVVDIDASPSAAHGEILEITMTYRIKSTQSDDQVIYQFNLNDTENTDE